jgi:hypothetical protein
MDRHELTATTWIKSSYSHDNGGNCLEVALGSQSVVPVRDSKNSPDGPVLLISPSAWGAFTAGLVLAQD